MATYVNDLRLKEIATGDESGTWGASTNTNLELIAEAFSFGTEAITTNADTHTTTIADGATDPGRSLFLKYTGTLDSACTITIGPNTVSKLWFIENATSGSQNIIIKQGSGATVTIPNGQTKAIYSDGAGSGGAMVDAFQDLSIPDLFIDDDLTIGDDLTFTSDSAVITFGADGDTTLTHTDGSGLTLNSTNKLMFNDASQFIQGSSATVLSLGATDEIDLTATAIDINGTLDVSGTTAFGGAVTITETGSGSAAGPFLNLFRDSSSPADADEIGIIQFRGDNDAGSAQTYARIGTTIEDASDGTEDGTLFINTITAGANRSRMIINGTATVFNEASADLDFRVESDGNANMLFVDAGNNTVSIGSNSSDGTLHVESGSAGTITSAAAANELVLESDGPVGMSLLFDDEANDAYGNIYWGNETDGNADGRITYFGSTYVTTADRQNMVFRTAGTERLRIDSDGTVFTKTTAAGTALKVESSEAGASSGPGLVLYRKSSSPADNDETGSITFESKNDASQDVAYGLIGSRIIDASDGTEDGGLTISTIFGGTNRSRIDLNNTETNFNQSGQDLDFRVESDANSHALFVDAGNGTVNINTSSGAKEGSAGGIQMQIGQAGGANAAQIFFDGQTADRGYVIGSVTNDFIIFNETAAGTFKERLSISDSEVILNQEGQDIDFRVESSGNDHMVFVDAANDKVGIGVSDPAGTPLHLKVASGDNKLRQETAAKDAFTLGFENSTGDTIIGTHEIYPAVRFLANGGMCFGSDTAEANALDDYEEGTFQTTWTATGGGTITLDSSFDDVTYTKIGRLVTVVGFFKVSSVSSPSGILEITLPFTSVSTSNVRSSVDLSFNILGAGGVNDAWGIIENNTNKINVYLGTGSSVGSFANRIVATTDLRLTASYVAA